MIEEAGAFWPLWLGVHFETAEAGDRRPKSRGIASRSLGWARLSADPDQMSRLAPAGNAS
jgi:hypothetical protein